MVGTLMEVIQMVVLMGRESLYLTGKGKQFLAYSVNQVSSARRNIADCQDSNNSSSDKLLLCSLMDVVQQEKMGKLDLKI